MMQGSFGRKPWISAGAAAAAAAVSEEWVCICKLCKLYPGKECNINWPRRVVSPRRGSNGEGEKGKPETRRFRSTSTWTPPQGVAIRCKSNQLWRNAAASRCRWHGGTMCAIHEDLNPKLIEEYNDPFELLVVEVEVV